MSGRLPPTPVPPHLPLRAHVEVLPALRAPLISFSAMLQPPFARAKAEAVVAPLPTQPLRWLGSAAPSRVLSQTPPAARAAGPSHAGGTLSPLGSPAVHLPKEKRL